MNDEQDELVNLVIDALPKMKEENEEPISHAFYLDGPGETGKTCYYNTLISWCRGQGIKVAPIGIAGTLLLLLLSFDMTHLKPSLDLVQYKFDLDLQL